MARAREIVAGVVAALFALPAAFGQPASPTGVTATAGTSSFVYDARLMGL
jgi:hypothetical protein